METNMVPNTQVRDLYRLEDLLWSLIQNLNAKKKIILSLTQRSIANMNTYNKTRVYIFETKINLRLMF